MLREFLREVGASFDASAGFDTPAQRLLKQASERLGQSAPIGYSIRASGGQDPIGTTPTPWIGFFDPGQGIDPMSGLYVVYILAGDRSGWTLSLNMGTERLARTAAALRRAGRLTSPATRFTLETLYERAKMIRRRLPTNVAANFDVTIDLRTRGARQARYEAATVLARTYALDDLPAEHDLAQDLGDLILAYEYAVAAGGNSSIAHANDAFDAAASDARALIYIFDPGEDRDAAVQTKGSYIRRPRHETGLRTYGKWLESRGQRLSTKVRPRDLVIGDPPQWLGEYKVVFANDEVQATRAAYSQLKEYRYLYHQPEDQIGLVAIFSQPISTTRVEWLRTDDVECIWYENGNWVGTPRAVQAGIAVAPAQ